MSSPVVTITDTYSDMDMQCPAEWENGFKEGLITEWGEAHRPASHLFTGEWQGSTFNFQIADKQGFLRAQQASFVDRYWNEALTVRMTTRANRALLGTPFTVFCGPIIDAQPRPNLLWDITLGDVVSQGLLSDQAEVPWRRIGDGFLKRLVAVSANLDRDAPEPIIYGRHTRATADTASPLSEDAPRIAPIYLGTETIDLLLSGPKDYHVWLVCGHAVSDIEIFVDDVAKDDSVSFFGVPEWLIPGYPFWTLEVNFFGNYIDIPSDWDGTLRRYTLVYGVVGATDPDACALGEKLLTAAVSGIEDDGDGTGTLITDRFQQYKHFLINYVANPGPQSYMSGAWLTNPVWDLFDGPVEKVDEDSFDTATDIGLERLLDGYIGAAAIGFSGRATARKWIADWNRSCACRFGITHLGQMRIFLLRPTEEAKAAAVLYMDAYEILDGSFRTELRWDEQATAIAYKADFDPVIGQWLTVGVLEDEAESENYGRTIPSEPREYPFAPGALQAEHLATLELRIRKHRPRYVYLDATIGPDPVTDDSLGYRDIGDYIRYVSFDAVQETREIRLAQVITPIVRVGSRRVGVVAMDCEDLIDYDVGSSPS